MNAETSEEAYERGYHEGRDDVSEFTPGERAMIVVGLRSEARWRRDRFNAGPQDPRSLDIYLEAARRYEALARRVEQT